ncbi:hypothetical protein [Streptomyces sp. NBC_00847]|uniref:hypothetical protein n=1 Tax=Streptomyces sp. NBC_00847 TaxID=2975850 RepID=UPI0022555D86|nr:hypothetical protein [Streptomyces sp. NBC_00847]MCX4884659.1 hypothetical protein [Streptomyces sp. NBC_00847]
MAGYDGIRGESVVSELAVAELPAHAPPGMVRVVTTTAARFVNAQEAQDCGISTERVCLAIEQGLLRHRGRRPAVHGDRQLQRPSSRDPDTAPAPTRRTRTARVVSRATTSPRCEYLWLLTSAAYLFKEGNPRPVRVLDTRRWTCAPSPDRSGFQWRLNHLSDDIPSVAIVGMACLYWSATDPDPDEQALLDYPWEPLPENPDEAATELTNRAKRFSPGHLSAWLCLRPVPRYRITARWVEPAQREAWAQASARLTALGLGSIQYGSPGDHATIAVDQLNALLDRAEQTGIPVPDEGR